MYETLPVLGMMPFVHDKICIKMHSTLVIFFSRMLAFISTHIFLDNIYIFATIYTLVIYLIFVGTDEQSSPRTA